MALPRAFCSSRLQYSCEMKKLTHTIIDCTN
nr:MAG TPA: hypothetical protein [Caudoviricetes sp.]